MSGAVLTCFLVTWFIMWCILDAIKEKGEEHDR